jgi:glycosyltransferase involved in cell wall biosynthesis
LDLDDIDSIRVSRLQKIAKEEGNHKKAIAMHLEIAKYKKAEAKYLNKFDKIFVCSQIDRKRITPKIEIEKINILPNVVRLPKKADEKPPSTIFTFLFVGSLNYYPNKDGLIFFCTNIIPIIEKNTERDFRLRVIGGGSNYLFRNRLSKYPRVDFFGYQEDLSLHYNQSDAAIVPIRAGAGTRIKLIEAMSYSKPIISTQIGAEGIEVENNKHLIIADSAEEFANGCLRIMDDTSYGIYLGNNAHKIVKEKYSVNTLKTIIEEIYSNMI